MPSQQISVRRKYVDQQDRLLRARIVEPVGKPFARPYRTGILPANLGAGAPVLDPAGAITIQPGFLRGQVNPPALVTSKYFNGFPTGDVLLDGTLLVGWVNDVSHGGGGGGTSSWLSRSTDGGNTWSTPTRIQADRGSGLVDISIENIRVVKTGRWAGRIILSFFTNSSGVTSSQCIISDDDGATWTAAINMYDTSSNYTTGKWNQGGPFVHFDDTEEFVQFGYGRRSSGAYDATCIISTDGGESWSPLAVAFAGTGSGTGGINEKPEECGAVWMDNGEVLVTIREDGETLPGYVQATNRVETIKTMYSNDRCRSFTAIATATPGAVYGRAKPSVYQFAGGPVVMITRSALNQVGFPIVGTPIYYYSNDYGRTWSPACTLDNRGLYFVYGAFIETSPNQVGLVYGTQYSEAIATRSEVNFTYLTCGSGRTPLGGIIGSSIRGDIIVPGRAVPSSFVTPPLASGSLASALQYFRDMGFPYHPLNVASLTGWWEADQIPTMVNDYNGTFAANTSLARLDGGTVALVSDSGTWQRDSGNNNLQHNNAAGACTWDVGQLVGSYSVDITWTNAGQVGVLIRRQATTDHIYVGCDSSSIKLYTKVANGAYAARINGSAVFANGTPRTVKVTIDSANLVSLYVDNVLQGTPYTLTGTEISAFGSSTKIGLLMSSADTTSRADNVNWAPGLSLGDTIGYLPAMDSLGYTSHLTQATANNKPTYKDVILNVFNGKPSLYFNGAKGLVSSVFASQSQPNAVVMVIFNEQVPGGAYNLFTANGASGNNQNINVATTGIMSPYAGTPGRTIPWAMTYPGGPYVITMYFNTTNSWMRVNGRYVWKGDNVNSIGSSAITQFQLGDTGTNPNFYCPAVGLFAHGAPALADLVGVERYCSQKYGIRMNYED